MRVVWARHAGNRLQEIQDFIERDSVDRAASFCDSLLSAAEQLSAHPFSGPVLPEDAAYRQLVIDEYRIVYRVAERAVYVMTIVAPGMTYDQAV